MRLVLARALGVLLGALALSLLWDVIEGVRYTRALPEIAVVVIQFITAPFAAFAAYLLWQRDRRATTVTGIACGLGTAVGALAAWTYAPPSEQASALFGAFGGGVVFAIAMVLLARWALKPAIPESTNPRV